MYLCSSMLLTELLVLNVLPFVVMSHGVAGRAKKTKGLVFNFNGGTR